MTTTTYKIKPLIPSKFHLNNQRQYLKFTKNKYRVLPHFILTGTDSDLFNYLPHLHKFHRRLLKIFKQLKFTHNLDLKNLYIHHHKYHLPYILSFAKKMCKTSLLSIHDSKCMESNFLTTFHLFPKYLQHLKTLNYSLKFDTLLALFTGQQPQIPEKMNPLSHYTRYQSCLENLKIDFGQESHKALRENLRFEKYPVSLKKLSFYGGKFEEPIISKSIDHLENLKALELDFDTHCSTEFLNSVFILLQRVPWLENLTLTNPHEAFIGLDVTFSSMQALTKLKYIRIRSCNLKFHHSKVLLKVIENLPLRSLDLDICGVDSVEHVAILLNLLEKMGNLDSLKLKVTNYNVLDSSIIEILFEKVDKLENLKNLSLKLTSSSLWGSNKYQLEEIDLPFTNLLTKKIPLESFRVECNQVEISNGSFLNLLKYLEKLVPHLKKIKLAIGEVLMEQKEFEEVIRFIENMRDIRVLKLCMLGVNQKNFFTEIVENVCKMKSLRSFSLGDIYEPVTKTKFFNGVERILSKPGLVKFDCDASKDLNKAIKKRTRVCPGLSWTKLKEKNPALKSTPRKVPILERHLDQFEDFRW